MSFVETAIASERIKQQLSEIRDTLRCTSSMADVPKLPNRKNSVFRIHMFLGLPGPDPLVRVMDPDPDPASVVDPDPPDPRLPDPDPLVRGMDPDPDPSIIKQI